MAEKKKRNQTIMNYRNKGYTIRSIAAIVHISPAMVHRIIKREMERE